MYKAYVVEVKELRKHNNADRLQIATFFGNDTVVDLNTKVGDIGIYFPSDGQLSVQYCEMNNLCRKKDASGNNIGGYLDPDKRNITAIRLRGEKSDGLFMPLSSLNYVYMGRDASLFLKVRDTIDVVNAHEICCKYIPRGNKQNNVKEGNHTRKNKVKVPIAPLFKEHADTEQLVYNLKDFKAGDLVEISLKMHGTSQRTGFLPCLKGYKRTLLDRILRREGTPIYEYDYVAGTRRIVLEDFEGGFYGNNSFRQPHHEAFFGKLWKGEEVFYEVVGFTDDGASIMGKGNNKKLGKEFVKQYGETTVFSYGCNSDSYEKLYKVTSEGEQYLNLVKVPTSDFYVYRMTMTNEDGEVVEYTPDFMRYRCEQMGVKTVPVFAQIILHDYDLEMDERTPGEIVKDICEHYYAGADPIGKTHIREGVVARIVNRPKFTAYKHKNFEFKVLEGLIKDNAETPDMEEAQELMEE